MHAIILKRFVCETSTAY